MILDEKANLEQIRLKILRKQARLSQDFNVVGSSLQILCAAMQHRKHACPGFV